MLLQAQPDAVPRACPPWMCLLLAIQDPVYPRAGRTAPCHEELAAVPGQAGAALLLAFPHSSATIQNALRPPDFAVHIGASLFWYASDVLMTGGFMLACVLVLQSSGSTPSGPLVTAMSRLATEHKADRASMGNAHRKRKMAEAFPSSSNAPAITKLNPNSKTLPPLSMGQPQGNAASGSQLQQPSFQGSLVSAAQQPSFARATSHPLPGLPAMDSRKRVKAESSAAMSAPGVSVQSAGKQSSGSMLAPSARKASSSKQASVGKQSPGDAQTHTEDSSRHTALRQTSPLQADCVTSPPAADVQLGSTAAAAGTQPAAHMPQEQQVAFPFRIVKAKTAQPASSSDMMAKSVATHMVTAGQAAACGPAAPAAAATQVSAVSASTAKPEVDQAAVSMDGENCMEALAEAAAAASEGSAASSSSREHSDDDKDAAEILRDLHNSAERPHNLAPDAGQRPTTSAPHAQLVPDLLLSCLHLFQIRCWAVCGTQSTKHALACCCICTCCNSTQEAAMHVVNNLDSCLKLLMQGWHSSQARVIRREKSQSLQSL